MTCYINSSARNNFHEKICLFRFVYFFWRLNCFSWLVKSYGEHAHCGKKFSRTIIITPRILYSTDGCNNMLLDLDNIFSSSFSFLSLQNRHRFLRKYWRAGSKIGIGNGRVGNIRYYGRFPLCSFSFWDHLFSVTKAMKLGGRALTQQHNVHFQSTILGA